MIDLGHEPPLSVDGTEAAVIDAAVSPSNGSAERS
jgi:hypothetical protein